VVINGTFSSWLDVISGVPQGSVLGPLLFLIYINDIGDCIKEFVYIFADDTKVMGPVSTDAEAKHLQETINQLNEWAERWQMEFNADKCSILHFGKNNPRHVYRLAGNGNPQVKKTLEYSSKKMENLAKTVGKLPKSATK